MAEETLQCFFARFVAEEGFERFAQALARGSAAVAAAQIVVAQPVQATAPDPPADLAQRFRAFAADRAFQRDLQRLQREHWHGQQPDAPQEELRRLHRDKMRFQHAEIVRGEPPLQALDDFLQLFAANDRRLQA